MLRAPDRDAVVRTVNVKLVANTSPAVGKHDVVDTGSGDTFAHFPVTSRFTVANGQETRVPLRFRLRWERPVSEVRGQRLDGMRLGGYTSVEASGIEGRTDSDPLRIGATPRRGIPAGPRGPRTTTFPAPSARSSTCGRASASSTRGP